MTVNTPLLTVGRDYEFDYQLPGDRRRRRARSTLIDANPNGWLVFAHGDMGDALNARWITVITEAEPDPDARHFTILPGPPPTRLSCDCGNDTFWLAGVTLTAVCTRCSRAQPLTIT